MVSRDLILPVLMSQNLEYRGKGKSFSGGVGNGYWQDWSSRELSETVATLLLPLSEGCSERVGKVLVVPTLFWKPKSLDQKKEPKRLNQELGGNYRKLKGKIGRVQSYTA